MRFLGNKNVKNTLFYIQLEEAIYSDGVDDYVSEAVKGRGSLQAGGIWLRVRLRRG